MRRRPSVLSPALVAAAVLLVARLASAQCNQAPRDFGGADWTPPNFAVLCAGEFRNIGTLNIPAGTTIFLDQVNPGAVTLDASTVRITGTVNGNQTGRPGGNGNFCGTGTAGQGGQLVGAGGGGGALAIRNPPFNTRGSGGGGGGNGGNGGSGGMGSAGGVPGTSGIAIGSDTDVNSILLGSGGGSADCGSGFEYAGSGGQGGGAIRIFGKDIQVTGSVTVNGRAGTDGGTFTNAGAGGGGGSGGTIILSASERLSVTGTLSATGGAGGRGLQGGGGGGGGAGGRVKFYQPFPTCSGVTGTVSVGGGAAGAGNTSSIAATAGDNGTQSCTNVEVAPVFASASANPTTVNEGSSVAITAAATDANVPWPGSTSSHLVKYSFDCNNDGTFEIGPQTSGSTNCSFNDNGTKTVAIKATDWNSIDFAGTSPLVTAGSLAFNGSVTTTLTVTVLNVPPTITAMTVPASANEGAAVAMSAVANDPSTVDQASLQFSWDFGDGSPTGFGSSLSHTYADNGFYTVTLTVKDKDGGFATKTASIAVANVAPTIAGITVPSFKEGVSGTFGASVTDPSSTDTAAGFTYNWDFGDGTAHTIGLGASAPAHVYAESGTYTVTLVVTDKDGGTVTKTATALVSNAPPVVSLTSAPATVAEGSVATVTGQATDTPGDMAAGFTYTFKWGDGSPDTVGTSATATHAYADNGSYTVTFLATDRNGGTSSPGATATIAVTNVVPTITTMTGPSGSIGEGVTVNFSAAATDPGTADVAQGLVFTWDFGDGQSLAGKALTAPTHKYADNGTYTVKLTVTDKDGGSTPTASTVSVSVLNVAPTVSIGAPTTITEGVSAAFTSTVSDPSTADTSAGFTYDWKWGDGSANTTGKTQSAPAHVYAESGTYTVTLTVTDKDGGAGTATTTVTVQNGAPVVTITSAPATSTEGAQVSVAASATDTPGDMAAGFTWTFKWGDGSADTVGTASTATHTYADNGSFTVQVTAKDRDGATSTAATKTIQVTNVAPSLAFSAPAAGNEGAVVTFTASATDPSTADTSAGFTWSWDFGDGSTGTAAPPQQHAYKDNGTFQVTLSVSDKDGGKATKTVAYAVANVPPVVALGAFPSPVTAESPATYTASAVDPSSADTVAGFTFTFEWGDSTTSSVTDTQASVQHTYLNPGTYTVKVTAKDKDGGVSNVDQRQLTVLEAQKPPKITLGPATQAVAEGSQANVTATFSDPNTGDKVTSIAWQFGDGQSATVTNPASPLVQPHTFQDSGSYTVTATASDSTGLSASGTAQVVVTNVAPTASITSVSSGASEGQAVTVVGSAKDVSPADQAAGFTYRWSWGDGSADSVGQGLSTTSHTYADSGTYTISLTATDKDGGTSTAVTQQIVVANSAPQVTLSGPSTGNEGDTLNFGATVSDASAADNAAGYTFTWKWGDGSPDTFGRNLNPQSHKFLDDGSFTVTLVVTDKDGGETTKTLAVTIANLAPVAVLGPFPSPVTKGAAATFTATATDAPADQAAGFTYTFDWGDGSAPTTSTSGSASHTFASTGTFKITLTATDKDGAASAAVSRNVTVTAPQVNNPPSITLAPASTTVSEGAGPTFTATFSDPDAGDQVVSIAWKFGDGQTQTSASPTSPLQLAHTYADNGTFTVTAVATDKQGAQSTAIATVTVSPVAPTVALGTVPATATEGQSVSFSATATDPSPADTAAGFNWTWKWGDGSADTSGAGLSAPSHAFADNGTFTVVLVVTDKDGAASSPVSATVNVTGVAPSANLVVPASGNEGEAMAFSAAVTDPSSADTAAGFTYTWDFGDGSTPVTGANLSAPSHAYADDGTYAVSLTVADKDGLSVKKTASATVKNVAPTASLGAFPSPVSKGLPATFTASATDPSATDTIGGFEFTFDWGDGQKSTANGADAAVSHTYATAGNFVVKVTAKDKDGATSAVVSRLLNVVNGAGNRAPTVALAPATQGVGEGGTASLTATFADPDTGDKVASLSWDFGDGKTQTSTNPTSPLVMTHTFADSGSYTVQVVATDTKGGTSTALATVTSTNVPPVVALGPVPGGINTGAAATFTATATDGSPADQAAGFTYAFTWGDGQTSTATGATASVQHTYATAGLYTVSVVATDKDGGTSAADSRPVAVGLGNVAPTLALTPPTQEIHEGEAAFFGATFSDPNAGDSVAKVAWDFGDGQTLEAATPVSPLAQSHVFGDSGTYTVTLVATDTTGLTTTATVQVTVADAAPAVALDAMPTDAAEGAKASFTATVADPSPADTAAGLQYAWDFGDGSDPITGKDLASAEHTYADNGSYTVKLTVTDQDGQAATSTAEVKVANVAPTLALDGAVSIDLGTDWAATATVIDPSATDTTAGFDYLWSFGDGSADAAGAELGEMTHHFDTPGSYTVTVTVTDKDGDFATGTLVVVVGDVAPTIDAGPDTDAVRRVPVVFEPLANWAGGTEKLTWAWDFGDGTTSTDAAPTHAYDTLGDFTVSVTVTDPLGLSATDTVLVHVKNRVPTATDVAIAPATAFTDDALTLAYTYADADGDAEGSTRISWYVDGKLVDALTGKREIAAEETVRGQVWEAEITPNDGIADGLAVKSASVTIGNKAPTASEVAIVPAAPKAADALTAAWTFADEDRDAEDGTEIHWTKNGAPLPEFDGRRVVPAPLKKGDEWTVTIVPNDGAIAGESVESAKVTVGNSAPVFTKLADLAVAPMAQLAPQVEAVDPDGDAVTISCVEGGSEFPLDPSVANKYVDPGTYTVTCEASDGTDKTQGTFRVAVGDVAPVVDAGPDRLVDPGRPVVTAVAKDALSRPLTYLWSVKSSPEPTVLLAPNAPSTTFFARKAGAYVLRVTASNGALEGTDEVTLTVRNLPPFADAGTSPAVAKVGEALALSGEKSVDPNGDALTYAWSFVSGPETRLGVPDQAATTVFPNAPGELVMRLTVSDGTLSSSADLVIHVAPKAALPHPPVAHAGKDQTALTGETITLDGSQSWDPDGDTLSYAWSLVDGAGATLTGADQDKATFVPDSAGTYTFELAVSDGAFTSRDRVLVTVSDANGNHRPEAKVTPAEQSAGIDQVVELDGSSSADVDGSSLTFHWAQVSGPQVAIAGADAAKASFVTTAAGDVVLELVVNDGQVDSRPARAVVHVTAGDATRPVAVAGADERGYRNELFTLDGSLSKDPSGGTLVFAWGQVSGPAVVLDGADTAHPTFTPTEPGEYVFQLVVASGARTSEPDTVTIIVSGDANLTGGCGCGPGGALGAMPLMGLLALLKRRRRA